MWSHAWELAVPFAAAVAASVGAICYLRLGRAAIRSLEKLALEALAGATDRDHVAETFGALIAGVPGRKRDRMAPVLLAARITAPAPPPGPARATRPGRSLAAGGKGRATAAGRR